jgi:hypothetical protein
MSRVVISAVCAVSFLAFPARAWAEEPAPAGAPAESPSAVTAPAPVVLTGEVGGGQTTPSPSSGTSSFFYQRAAGRWSPIRTLALKATFRATEDLARSPDAGSIYRTTGDVVFYGGLDASYDLSEHFTLTLGANGSPTSQRDIGTSILAARPKGPSQTVDAAVRSRTSSVGGLVEVGYDSAEEAGEHDADVALDVSGTVTRFGTEQSVLAPDFAAAAIKEKSASLIQGRLGAATTLTILENTDLSVDFAYFVYDQKNPGDVGLFNSSTASGITTSFGAGLPMLPARFTLRPELGERLGPVMLSAYYQYANLAVDEATGHTVGGRAQIMLGSVKLFAVGSYRADVFTDATAATWTAGAGASFRL